MNDLFIRGADGKLYNANGEVIAADAAEMPMQMEFTPAENSAANTWFASTWFASTWFASTWFASTWFASADFAPETV